MSNTVEQIKQRLGIVDVVEAYLKLERAGGALKAKCPFHNEKTPSFFVSPDRGTYYCFGCGAKGDIFEFVERFEGLDFVGALKVLAAKAGVEITREKPKAKSEKDRLYAAMEEAMEFYKRELARNSEAKNYLLARGLSEKTIGEFDLGYAPLEWRSVSIHLNKKGWSDAELVKAGLIKMKDTEGPSGSSHYDRFRGRVMFPLFDTGGRVIAFSGRILNDDGKSAKYLNSPQTPLFDKSNVLYGLDKAKIEIRRLNFSILVEGQMDLLMSHQAGFRNTVASSGTALTDNLSAGENMVNNLGLVRRLSTNIIFALDGDPAGITAAIRGAQIALSLGMDVKIAPLPSGVDPADFLKEKPKEWKEVVKRSQHVVDFALDNAIEAAGVDSRKRAKEVRAKVLPLIASVEGKMEQAHFVSKVREKTGLNEEAIWEDLRKVTRKELVPEAPVSAKKEIFRKDSIVQRIFAIYFWQQGIEKPSIDPEALEGKLIAIVGEEEEKKIRALYEPAASELIFQAELMYKNRERLSKDAEELLENFEAEYVRDEFAQVTRELGAAERGKDDEKAQVLLARCQELSKRLEKLSKRRL